MKSLQPPSRMAKKVRRLSGQLSSPVLLAVIAATIAFLVHNQNAQVYSFFQSPPAQSPVVDPTDTPEPVPPTETPVPVPTDTPVPAPTDTPVPVEPAAEEQQPTEPEPVEEAAPEEVVPEPTATEEPVVEEVIQPEDTNPTPVQLAPVQPAPVEPAPVAPPPAEVSPAQGGPVVLNEVKLIDTAAQWFAWVWLCFGVGVILLVPIIFLFLQLRGSRMGHQ